MKKTGYKSVFAICAIVMMCLALFDCSFWGRGSSKGTMVLVLHSDNLSRTLEPGVDLVVASYDIEGSGPDGASFSVSGVTDEIYTKDEITAGDWTITVTGNNADGAGIVGATKSFTVTAGGTAAVSVLCVPFTGTGSCTLSLSWPTDVIGNPAIVATMTPVSGGEASSLSFSIVNETGTWSDTAMANGYYTLSIKLKDASDNDRLVWAWVETVLILKGETTRGAWVLTGDQVLTPESGGLTIGVNYDPAAPISVNLGGNWPTLIQGRTMTVTATGAPTPDSWQWYLDGDPVSGETSNSLSFGSDLALGTHYVNVTAEKGSRHGLAGFGFTVMVLSNAHRMSISSHGTVYLTDSGELWFCGTYESYGIKTMQRIVTDVTKVDQYDNSIAFVKEDGTLWRIGGSSVVSGFADDFLPIGITDDVIDVAVGENHMLILKSDHSLWALGGNDCGQLGDGTTTGRTAPVKIMSDVVSIEAGSCNSFVIKEDGSLWGFGRNARDVAGCLTGLLGDGTTTNQSSPVKIMENISWVSAGFLSTIAIKADGGVYGWGLFGRYPEVSGGTWNDYSNSPRYIMADGAQADASYCWSMILKTNGELYAFGSRNENGQFGLGSTVISRLPLLVQEGVVRLAASNAYSSYDHAVVLKDDGALYGVGRSDMGYFNTTEVGDWYNFKKFYTFQ